MLCWFNYFRTVSQTRKIINVLTMCSRFDALSAMAPLILRAPAACCCCWDCNAALRVGPETRILFGPVAEATAEGLLGNWALFTGIGPIVLLGWGGSKGGLGIPPTAFRAWVPPIALVEEFIAGDTKRPWLDGKGAEPIELDPKSKLAGLGWEALLGAESQIQKNDTYYNPAGLAITRQRTNFVPIRLFER